jgi:hypothetical protein
MPLQPMPVPPMDINGDGQPMPVPPPPKDSITTLPPSGPTKFSAADTGRVQL